jgi:hypothetical protein
MENSAPSDLHRALAVAMAERKTSVESSTQAWKRKALIARATLNRLSATLRRLQVSQEANGSDPIALQLLQALEQSNGEVEDREIEPSGFQETADAVLTRSSQLHQFINAVEVQHTGLFRYQCHGH